MLPQRLRFGAFIAPFHPLDENPTLAIQRDLELVEWHGGADLECAPDQRSGDRPHCGHHDDRRVAGGQERVHL